MSAIAGSEFLQAGVLVALVVACALPLSGYLVDVLEGRPLLIRRALGPLERSACRLVGAREDDGMDWRRFLASALALTAVSFIGLFTLLICQGALPWNPEGFPGLALDTAFNMTASFVTNTNWQPIAGETNLSYFSQAVGLAVQNFLSPAVGIAVAFALLRGLASSDGGKLGNFFVDVVRAVLYVLLPLSLVLALVGVWQGSPQTFQGYEMVQLLEPVSVDAEGALVDADDPTAVQEVTEAVVPLGPQSSQVAIKQLGTNGGGFNGANSASALENPTPLTNLLQCAAMPLIPFALVFAFGRMVGDRRQSRALMTVVLAILAAGPVFGFGAAHEHRDRAVFPVVPPETAATPQLSADGAVYLGALDQSAGNMEGKECRIGVGESAAWTALTSATSNGSANASIEAMTPIGTLVPLALIGLGEVVGGGVGTGLVGLLGFAVLAVFVASLMIGRSPEYLGKKLGPAEMRMAVVIVVAPALAILLAASVLVMSPASAAAVGTPAPFGFTELLYAATSAGGNNGSGLSGLSSNTPLINVVLGVEMLFARLVPLAAALVLAGNLAQLKVQATGAVGLSTSGALFAVLLLVIIVLIGALSLLPAFALGPLAEQFMGAF